MSCSFDSHATSVSPTAKDLSNERVITPAQNINNVAKHNNEHSHEHSDEHAHEIESILVVSTRLGRTASDEPVRVEVIVQEELEEKAISGQAIFRC